MWRPRPSPACPARDYRRTQRAAEGAREPAGALTAALTVTVAAALAAALSAASEGNIAEDAADEAFGEAPGSEETSAAAPLARVTRRIGAEAALCDAPKTLGPGVCFGLEQDLGQLAGNARVAKIGSYAQGPIAALDAHVHEHLRTALVGLEAGVRELGDHGLDPARVHVTSVASSTQLLGEFATTVFAPRKQ